MELMQKYLTTENAGHLRQLFVFFLLENQLRHPLPHFVLILKKTFLEAKYL